MKQWYLLEGDIYPYVRTTQRQKWADPRWGRYIASQNGIRQQVKAAMARNGWTMFPKVPLRLGVAMYVSTGLHKRDASNQLKAIEDALQRIVYTNDAWLDEVSLVRFKAEEDRALVMIVPIGDGGRIGFMADLLIRAMMNGIVVE